MPRHAHTPRQAPGRPLSLAQQRALVALVRVGGELGSEVEAGMVARVSGLRPNVVVLALHGLVRRQLAVRHEGSEETWSPTLSGRGMARYVRSREPRTAPVGEFRTSDG